MKLTTKGRYAVTAMLDLTIHDGMGPISLADIARRQGISLSYLEQLFSRLRRRGLVSSVRGPGGGYVLGRPAAEIDIAAVVDAVDEGVGGARRGAGGELYVTHLLWQDLSDQIREYLRGISLDDLKRRQGVAEVADRQDRQENLSA